MDIIEKQQERLNALREVTDTIESLIRGAASYADFVKDKMDEGDLVCDEHAYNLACYRVEQLQWIKDKVMNLALSK